MNPYDNHLLISNDKENPDVAAQVKIILETFLAIPAKSWLEDPDPGQKLLNIATLEGDRTAALYCTRLEDENDTYRIVFLATFPPGKTRDAEFYLDLEALDLQISMAPFQPKRFNEILASLVVIGHEELDAIGIPGEGLRHKAPFERICADLIMSIYPEVPSVQINQNTQSLSIWLDKETKRWNVQAFTPGLNNVPHDLSASMLPLPSIYNLYGPSPTINGEPSVSIEVEPPIDIISVDGSGIDPVSSMHAIQHVTRLIDTYAKGERS